MGRDDTMSLVLSATHITERKQKNVSTTPQYTNAPHAYLVVHGIQSVCCDDIPSMYQSVQGTRRLCQMTIITIIWSNAVQNQIQTIAKVGYACS